MNRGASEAAKRFLRGEIGLSDAAVVGLHQELRDPTLVGRVIQASRNGAKLAADVQIEGSVAELVAARDFDWGAPELKADHSDGLVAPPTQHDTSTAVAAQTQHDTTPQAQHGAPAITLPPGNVAAAPAPTPAARVPQSDIKADLRKYMSGWGSGEDAIFARIANATSAEREAVCSDAQLLKELRNDLSGGPMEKLSAQLRSTFDHIVETNNDSGLVSTAMRYYWSVELDDTAQVAWPVLVLRKMHDELKLIPSQDTRSRAWKKLVLSGNPAYAQRAAFGNGEFTLGAAASTTNIVSMGYETALQANAARGATQISVQEGGRLSVGDQVAVGMGYMRDVAKITAIAGNTWTLDRALTYEHPSGISVTPDDSTATRLVSWLDATTRHEIGHSVDTAVGGVTGYTQGVGGWWVGTDFDTWANAMGNPWETNDRTQIAPSDRSQIKDTIVAALKNTPVGGASLLTGLPGSHPIAKFWRKNVPVIMAAEACVSKGDGFYNSPTTLLSRNGYRFMVSNWYKQFMYCKEDVASQRVSNYSLYAPAEFFAESYTTFYEEAGKPGVTDADYGRLIRNASWRSWIRTNIHERGHAPAGTDARASAAPGSASTGKQSGNPT